MKWRFVKYYPGWWQNIYAAWAAPSSIFDDSIKKDLRRILFKE